MTGEPNIRIREVGPDESRCVALHPDLITQCVLIAGHDGKHRDHAWAGDPPVEWRPGQRRRRT
jgi:hypothetical protein